MNPISEDIRELLIAYTPTNTRTSCGDGTMVSSYFVGREPEYPRNTVTLYDYGFGSQDPLNNIDENSIQFRSRNNSYLEGYRALHKIKLFLEGLYTEKLLEYGEQSRLVDERLDLDSLFDDPDTDVDDRNKFRLNGSEYVGFWSQTNIAALGSIEREYFLFTYNMRVIRSPVESGNRV